VERRVTMRRPAFMSGAEQAIDATFAVDAARQLGPSKRC